MSGEEEERAKRSESELEKCGARGRKWRRKEKGTPIIGAHGHDLLPAFAPILVDSS